MAGNYRPLKRLGGAADQDDQPRFEMSPMLDVVFLLLIFFLFQLQHSANVRGVPVEFASISGQSGADYDETIAWIFIDKDGNYQLNNRSLTWEQLQVALLKFAAEWRASKKPVYLAVDSGSHVDQNLWPLAVKVIDLAHQLDIHLVIVGAKEE